jgi:hypothetical protein
MRSGLRMIVVSRYRWIGGSVLYEVVYGRWEGHISQQLGGEYRTTARLACQVDARNKG